MTKKEVLIRPLITEKAEMLSENKNQFSFVVAKKANKLEIKRAVEDMYNVTVETVNTTILPGRFITRNTKSGLLRGRKPSFKKAIVTLPEGETIDFYGDL